MIVSSDKARSFSPGLPVTPLNREGRGRATANVLHTEATFSERVLDSIRTRFSKDVSNVWNGIDVRKQLHAPAAPGADQEALFKRNHELFRSGLEEWMESLAKITQEWVSRLARIASRDPSLATDDPARWARCRVQEMLGKGLGIVVIGPDAAVPPWFQVKKVRSNIERWIMHVCDKGPDFDRSESGYHEPWCAPVWGQKNFMISFWIRKGRPDRLTVEQTVLEVRSAENMFIGRLDHVPGDAEDQARVDLATEQTSSPSTTFSGQALLVDNQNGGGARQSPIDARRPHARKRSGNERKSFVRPLLENKGWSVNDWATNSHVDFHTADSYLKNKSNPYPSTLTKLAGSLGVPVAQLPK